MKKESNLIDTKENIMNNKEESYNYYKSNLPACTDKEIYSLIKDDKEIALLEKGCNILGKILKVEAVITLIVITFAIIFNGFPENAKSQGNSKKVSISQEIDYNIKN